MAKHHVSWKPDATVAQNARTQLPRLVGDYFAKVRKDLAAELKPAQLHRVRLQTKRLRYTMELFRPCYGPGFQLRLDELSELQSMLGNLNDAVASRKLLAGVLKSPAQKTHVDHFLKNRIEKKAAEFCTHWMEVFDAPGRERWWTGYLAREARTPGGVQTRTRARA